MDSPAVQVGDKRFVVLSAEQVAGIRLRLGKIAGNVELLREGRAFLMYDKRAELVRQYVREIGETLGGGQ